MAEITSISTSNPVTVRPVEELITVIDLMSKRGFRRLPVTWEGQLVGIITSSDVLKVLSTGDHDLLHKELHNFMTTEPLVVYRDDQVSKAISIMLKESIGGLPVLSPNDGSLAGIITERDLVKAFVDSIADADLEGFINLEPPQLLYNKTTVKDVIDAMVEYGSSRLILINTKKKVKGIVTTKDILRHLNNEIIKFGKAPEGILTVDAIDLAATDILTTDAHKSVAEVTQILLEHKIGGIPVVEEDGTLIGMFTERNLLQLIGTYNLM